MSNKKIELNERAKRKRKKVFQDERKKKKKEQKKSRRKKMRKELKREVQLRNIQFVDFFFDEAVVDALLF